MDPNFLLHTLGDGAAIAAALALARLLLDYGLPASWRRLDHDDLRRRQQRDAEARLERVLHDRLAEADRRLERAEQDMHAERLRQVTLEHEHAALLQAYAVLWQQYALLQTQAEHPRPRRGT